MTQQVFPFTLSTPAPSAIAVQEETALPVSKDAMPGTGHPFLVWLVTAVTLGSGLVNLYSVIGPGLPERIALLRTLFPLEFLDGSRFLAALVGFALVVLSINIYKRKHRAFTGVVLLSLASVLLHLTKSLDYEEASLSLVLLVLLFWARPSFTVRSTPLDLRAGLLRFALALAVAFGYGTAGFWLLDHREFGLEFSLPDAVRKTLLQLSLQDLGLHPRTRYAQWFLDSLDLMTLAAGGYALTALFRPVLYRYGTLESERRLARGIVERHGRSVQDFFKYAADKSLFFSPARTCFLAYRVADDYALVMGDPVGPEEEFAALVRDFADYCAASGWSVGFHGVLPDFLPIYRRLGFRRLKIGDDAVVDLTRFSLEGKDNKSFRYRINRLEKAGVRCVYWEAPLPEEVLRQAQEVSDEWLRLPGRRERSFTLGRFESDYVRSTPLWGAVDSGGQLLAFLNIIPSYTPGEATVDLMRYRLETPNGLMDYLLVKHFLFLKEQGYARFNLGMAPLAGFGEQERASIEERAIHYFVHHLNFLFRFSGLLQYKAKYATIWEPRYAVYQTVLDLPRLVRALSRLSEQGA